MPIVALTNVGRFRLEKKPHRLAENTGMVESNKFTSFAPVAHDKEWCNSSSFRLENEVWLIQVGTSIVSWAALDST